MGNQLVKANLGWPAVFGLLNVAYYVLHYMFASQVGLCVPENASSCMTWHCPCVSRMPGLCRGVP